MDSYAMRTFAGVEFYSGGVPDATTLYRFRRMLNKNGLREKLDRDLNQRMAKEGFRIRRGKSEEALLVRRRAPK